MKKIITIVAAILVLGGCKKKEDDVSRVVTVSQPTITFNGSQYYSINTGGTVPTLSATAYDSVLKETYSVELEGVDDIDNTTPGLYVVQGTATNSNGYKSSANAFIAVTNVSASTDLSGRYVRGATGGVANVTKVGNGLYVTDNVGGVARATNPNLLFPVAFVHLNDTTIHIAAQNTPSGILESADEYLDLSSPTTYEYRLAQGGVSFGTTAIRVFVKQ